MPIRASLSIAADAPPSSGSVGDASRRTAMAALAARHGVVLTGDAERMRWLEQADLPPGLDANAYAALAVLVQHIYSLSSPGGNDRSER